MQTRGTDEKSSLLSKDLRLASATLVKGYSQCTALTQLAVVLGMWIIENIAHRGALCAPMVHGYTYTYTLHPCTPRPLNTDPPGYPPSLAPAPQTPALLQTPCLPPPPHPTLLDKQQ